MNSRILGYAIGVLALSMGSPVFADDAAIAKKLSGKTILHEAAEFKIRRNGRLTGKAGPKRDIVFKGAWAIRNGKWCRTFTEPEQWAGTECQPIEFGNGTITITGRNGPQVWQIK